MNRRDFIKALSAAGITIAAPYPLQLMAQTEENKEQRFLLTLYAAGGWDVTHYCDPKENSKAGYVITDWSKTDVTKMAGNIAYAPFANNQAMFSKHYSKMCVINGIEMNTNAHMSGNQYTLSGQADRFPTLSALYASIHGQGLQMPYIQGAGYGETQNLTKKVNPSPNLKTTLASIAEPTKHRGYDYFPEEVIGFIKEASDAHKDHQLAQSKWLHNDKKLIETLKYFEEGGANFTQLNTILNSLPSMDNDKGHASGLKFSLACFASGLSCCAELKQGMYDSHGDNTLLQDKWLEELNSMIDYSWQQAEALGIADKLTIIVSSDFSRTPYYNQYNGKDHHSVGSMIVMQKSPTWGNRVVGQTTSDHRVQKIDFSNMSVSEDGQIMTINHVHKAVRKMLDMEGDVFVDRFNFGTIDTPNIFL